jgi:hypothetical protein
MGIEFIYKVKDIYQKSWARSAERVKTPDLNTIKPEEIQTILVRPLDGYRADTDDEYELQLTGDCIEIYRNKMRVGVGINVPPSITDALREIGGKTIGFAHRVRNQSGLVDVKIWIWGLN